MNPWVKIALGAVAAAAVIGLYFGEEYYTKKEEAEKATSTKAVAFESAQVRKISLVNEKGSFVMERGSATEDWRIISPTTVKADQDTVNNLVSAIQTQSIEQELPGTEQAAKLTGEEAVKFGVANPKQSIELTLEGGKSKKLVIGNDLNIGNNSGGNFIAVSVYAANPEKKNLMVVNSGITSTLKKEFSDLRTKIVGEFVATNTTAITVARQGSESIELSKKEKDWVVVKPREVLADQNNVGLFIDKWARLRLDKVTEKADVTDAQRKEWNLLTPSGSVTMRGAENKVLQTFEVGFAKDKLHIVMSDGAVGTVDVGQLTDLFPDLRYFRDRRVMRDVSMADVLKIKTPKGRIYQKENNNWFATEGPGVDKEKQSKDGNSDAGRLYADWEFMAADDIVENPEAANLAKFGIDKPVTQFSFMFTDASKRGPEDILVGKRVPNDEKKVYIKRSSKPEIYVVETAWLDNLTKLDEDKKPDAPTPAANPAPVDADKHAQK